MRNKQPVNNSNSKNQPVKDSGYSRRLKDRHVQLIALGGIIGSGYFLGTGEVINLVGPAVFIAYVLGGLIIFLTMLCMGELGCSDSHFRFFCNLYR